MTTNPEAAQVTPEITLFEKLLRAKWAEGKFLCQGIDPDYGKFPTEFRKSYEDPSGVLPPDKVSATRDFLKRIIDATHTRVACYKPNIAFFYKLGFVKGAMLLEEIIKYIKEVDPMMPIILDWKVGDIGNTNIGYLEVVKELGVHAFTVSPYMGIADGIDVLMSDPDLYAFVLCITSNKGADEIQQKNSEGTAVYMDVANSICDGTRQNVGLVTGAPNAEYLAEIRQEVGDDPIFLIPGVGAQQGDVNTAIAGAQTEIGGFVVNVSRNTLYVTEEAEFEPFVITAVEKYHEQTSTARKLANAALDEALGN